MCGCRRAGTWAGFSLHSHVIIILCQAMEAHLASPVAGLRIYLWTFLTMLKATGSVWGEDRETDCEWCATGWLSRCAQCNTLASGGHAESTAGMDVLQAGLHPRVWDKPSVESGASIMTPAKWRVLGEVAHGSVLNDDDMNTPFSPSLCNLSDVHRRWDCDDMRPTDLLSANNPAQAQSCHGSTLVGGTLIGPLGYSARSCDVVPVRSAALRRCFAAKKITFIGSSRTRYLYLDFAKLALDGGLASYLDARGESELRPGVYEYAWLNDTVLSTMSAYRDTVLSNQSTEHRRKTIAAEHGTIELQFYMVYGLHHKYTQDKLHQAIVDSDVIVLSSVLWDYRNFQEAEAQHERQVGTPRCNSECYSGMLRELVAAVYGHNSNVVWHTELWYESAAYMRPLLEWDNLAVRTLLQEQRVARSESESAARIHVLDLTTPSMILHSSTYDRRHYHPPAVRLFSALLANQLCGLPRWASSSRWRVLDEGAARIAENRSCQDTMAAGWTGVHGPAEQCMELVLSRPD